MSRTYELDPYGVKWMGAVPRRWSIEPAKRHFVIQLGKMLQNGPTCDTDRMVPYFKALHVLWGTVNASDLPEMWASPSEIMQYGVQRGDLLVCEGGEVGRAGIASDPPVDSIIQNALHRVRAKNTGDVRFLMYVLNSVSSAGWFDVLCNRATIAHFTGEKFAALRIPSPPLEEQRAIAAFLDRETARIDALIEKKRRQIELLREKRSALISHAVTKGLDPNASMKDSGIEWLGEIPEKWEVKRLKYSATILMGQSPSSDDYTYNSDGLPFLQGNAEFTDKHPVPRLTCKAATKIAPKEALLISVRAPVGALNIADRDYGIGRGLCAVLVRRETLLQPFAWYLLQVIREELFSIATGSTYEAVTADEVAALAGLIPPLPEQRAIAAFLDRETARIDALIEKVEKSIELLREYRTALISAAVTGKIDVRKEVA